MISRILSRSHLFLDKLLRVKNRLRRSLISDIRFQSRDKFSDSEVSFYVPSLIKINTSKEVHNFRRNFDYREILEHVDFDLGHKYLQRIEELGYSLDEIVSIGLANDTYGNPRTYRYREYPRISPTTLRYLSVACELRAQFNSLQDANVIEIGAGYGGQCSIISRMFNLASYSIYDLPEAQDLTKHYLEEVRAPLKPIMLDIVNIQTTKSDLLRSNYAFSELPKAIQEEYLTKTLSTSARGYLIMNSGGKNFTGRNQGKLTIDEIREFLPHSRLLPELPITGPDNYVMVWG